MMKLKITLMFALALLLHSAVWAARPNPEFAGSWQLNRELSSPIDPFRFITLDIRLNRELLVIDELRSTGRRKIPTRREIDLSAEMNEVPIEWWNGNRHIGAYIGADKMMQIAPDTLDEGQTLAFTAHFTLESSQGPSRVRTYTEYRLTHNGQRLVRMELRSTRSLPILHVFERK